MKELNSLIRELREDNDLTQRAVASYLNISQQTYSNYENGKREIPTRIVVLLSKYYGVSCEYLLGMNTGNANNAILHNTYFNNITIYDIICVILKFRKEERKDLIKYINYLEYCRKQKGL